ncbi:asparagine synthetase [glutamine-hydrolyzing] 2 isoform X3 [Spinacia oleracea]|uniref:Asparagine synthetase [glutamine-hydrolyzing] 2 isoform X3 n=1 Tax=Spinacia oleracea TaxID=3562 RepID=A0ABM3RLL8_SPIOL|nr:asparagine synthetase [glutamine-hydrolyzing] 2-like isoform X3 [Spinacia oleracea]
MIVNGSSLFLLDIYIQANKYVLKRLMTDVPFGVLLSGGLDSSLVAAVASRYLEEMEGAYQWGSQLHSFCIGLEAAASLSGSCSLFFEERKHVKVSIQ